MQMMFDQNCKMMNQLMDAANAMAGAASAAESEKPEESTALEQTEDKA
jgi:hypothetical protein